VHDDVTVLRLRPAALDDVAPASGRRSALRRDGGLRRAREGMADMRRAL
jgi:hypothetical protein